MKRILATFTKEWELMRRDMGGISLIFLMPILLVVIMALVQDAPFKDFKQTQFKTLLLDYDKGNVSQKLKQGLESTKQFELIEKINNQELSIESAKKEIKNGKYSFAIVIKNGVSAEIVNSGNLIANHIAQQMGIQNKMPNRTSRDTNNIELIFDPTAKPTFKMAISNALEKLIEKIQSEIILDRISAINPNKDSTNHFDFEKTMNQVKVQEIGVGRENKYIQKINSVQHNVPSWSIFGIFFMILIISENLIVERNSGSWTRIKLISGNLTDIFIGKILFFVILGIIQFYFMMLIGIFAMPLLGLDSLNIGNHPFALFTMAFSISLCAATIGILLGIVFNSGNQALPVGAISVVILSAIGGVWIPLEILPPLLQKISYISPMRWSLQGINNILLRDEGIQSITSSIGVLITISLLCLLIAKEIEKKKS